MRIKSLKLIATPQEIAKVLQKHTGSPYSECRQLARNILNGGQVELPDDWALEQDLKDLGIRVD